MLRRSFRTRLMVLNMAMLLAVLIAMATAVFFSLRTALYAVVDNDLQTRATQFATAFSNGRFGMGMGGMGMGSGMGRGRGGANNSGKQLDADMQRLILFHRPRWFDANGTGIGPFSELTAWDKSALGKNIKPGQKYFSNIIFDGEAVRVLTIALRRNDGFSATLQVARPMGEITQIEKKLGGALLALAVPALLLAALGSWFLTRQVLLPVRLLTQAAKQIGDGDLARRININIKETARGDEISQLAHTFNDMTARLEKAFAQTQQALEQQRRFTSDVSHELRTPLARLKGVTSLMLEGNRSADDYRDALKTADAAADAMTKLITDLLLLARSDAGQLRLEKMPASLENILQNAIGNLSRCGAKIECEIEDIPEIYVDAFHLQRVFLNLLDNARRHTPDENNIYISATRDAEKIYISIRDCGEGIAPQHLPHLGERFFRADASRTRHDAPNGNESSIESGHGLGLAIAQSIVAAHGGTLRFESALGQGTTATITLPIAAPR